jgi:hypothetical protein
MPILFNRKKGDLKLPFGSIEDRSSQSRPSSHRLLWQGHDGSKVGISNYLESHGLLPLNPSRNSL